MCVSVWSSRRSLLMGELGWMSMEEYISTRPPEPRNTWREADGYGQKPSTISKCESYKTQHIQYIWKRKKRIEKAKEVLARMCLKAIWRCICTVCRIILWREQLIWLAVSKSNLEDTKTPLPKWFMSPRTLKLPEFNEISIDFYVRLHKPVQWSQCCKQESNCLSSAVSVSTS